MSGKLDQSLDQIMQDTKPAGGRPRGRGPARPRPTRNAKSKAKAAIAAPTGGVQKTRINPRTAPMVATAIAKSTMGESKIMVSNLPSDVEETQIKDYFSQTIGHVKKVLLTYDRSGRSHGNATIIFRSGDSAQKAVKQLDGIKIDNRPMRVELIMAAREVPRAAPAKGLADRVAQPKSAAKDKGKPKTNGAAVVNGTKKTKDTTRKAGRAGRPKKKSAEELDAEMADYFQPDTTEGHGVTQQAAAVTGGDAMVDEVL